jgi:hypothetical protein
MPHIAYPKLMILAAALLFILHAPPAHADAVVSVTQGYISKDRVDIGAQITVGYRLVWTSSRSAVEGATVTINGNPCEDWGNGWYILTDTAADIAYRQYNIGYVRASGIYRTFQMDCETETCVFDKVIVQMHAEYDRVNVGEEPPIIWYAYYAFNFETFKGDVVFNYTGPYNSVGSRCITVDHIMDPVNGIHGFEAGTVKITWDTVVIQLYSDKRRYDVGEEATISYTAHYKYDTKPFIGTVELNDTLTKDEVGKYRYTVKSIDDERNGVTSFTCNVVEAIYDKIIVEVEALDDRINVGEVAPLAYRAHHAYDGQEFSGNIYFTPIVLESPGSANIRVVRVSDMVYFLSAFEANTVPMIWDQVQVDLRVEDDRVDLGDDVDVEVSAHYAYDGRPLDPSMVRLNARSHSMDTVGNYTFEVTGVEPGEYGVTSVSYNKCKVIWDQVALEVESPSERVILGTKSGPEVNAYYSYDHEPFTGSYRLDKEFSSDLGSETYKVVEVTDNLYGLKGFTCSEGTYYFDSVEVEHSENQFIPGMVQVTLTLRYMTDGSPVSGADIVVNGESCTYQGNGVYSASLTSLLPMTSLESLVRVDNHVVEQIEATTPMVGNIAAIAIALLIVILVLSRIRR